MPLTTEQKINLLILAGFEPYMFAILRGRARIIHADGRALAEFHRGPWELHKGWRADTYIACGWAELRVGECPDELIYQAIETTG